MTGPDAGNSHIRTSEVLQWCPVRKAGSAGARFDRTGFQADGGSTR